MKQESKHRSQEQLAQTAANQATAREFATAEELLRHDAAQTQVPPVIAERLTQSIAKLPQPPRSWWQRWLKR
jgi:uncharacterized protein YprB with RNaseH-like and TPR domain